MKIRSDWIISWFENNTIWKYYCFLYVPNFNASFKNRNYQCFRNLPNGSLWREMPYQNYTLLIPFIKNSNTQIKMSTILYSIHSNTDVIVISVKYSLFVYIVIFKFNLVAFWIYGMDNTKEYMPDSIFSFPLL